MWKNPGSYLTSGNPYAAMLMRNSRKMNNGTNLGGIASVLSEAGGAYLYAQDRDKAEADQQAKIDAQAVRAKGLLPQTIPGARPDGTADRIVPGSLSKAARLLSGMKGNPYAMDYATELAMQDLTRKPDARQTAKAADGYLYYQDDGSRVFPNVQAPPEAPPDLPTSVQEYQYAQQGGFQGSYADWKANNKPSTTVEFNEKGFDELSKMDAQAISGVGEGVRTLRTMLPDLERMVSASEQFGTGATGNMKLWAGQWADALGVDGVENLGEGELIRAIQNRLAPQMRATGSGASSDRDVQMFLTSLPNLMQTPGGNRLIAQNFRRILERKQAEERIMRQHYRENGGSLDGVYQRIDKELGPSTFSDEDRSMMVQANPAALPRYPQDLPPPMSDAPEQGGIAGQMPGGQTLPPNVTMQPNGRLRWRPSGQDWTESSQGQF